MPPCCSMLAGDRETTMPDRIDHALQVICAAHNRPELAGYLREALHNNGIELVDTWDNGGDDE